MAPYLCIMLFVAVVGWLVEWHFGSVERAKRLVAEAARDKAVEDMHRMANSAMLGCPVVKWNHPEPSPASDKWYYRIRAMGADHLFTEEAVVTARKRASLLLTTKA